MPGNRIRKQTYGSRAKGRSSDIGLGGYRETGSSIGSSISSSNVKVPTCGVVPDVPLDDSRQKVAKPLNEHSREDHELVIKLQDVLAVAGKHSYVQKLLRAHDPEALGGLTQDAMRAALGRLNIGLNEADKTKVVSRLCVDNRPLIPYNALFEFASNLEPLGARQNDTGSGSGTNVCTRAPWENVTGPLTAWTWQAKPQGIESVTGHALQDSYQQRQEDSLLLSMVSRRMGQSAEKLRRLFRKHDPDHSGQINQTNFVQAMEAAKLNVPQHHLKRMFEQADAPKCGLVDYMKFVDGFEAPGMTRQVKLLSKGSAQDPAVMTVVDKQDEEALLHSPVVLSLQQRLQAKGHAAHAVFVAHDAAGDGKLNLQELTKSCQTLEPGIQEQHVAALIAACTPSHNGHVSYQHFLKKVSDDLALPSTGKSFAIPNSHGSSCCNEDETWGHSPLYKLSRTQSVPCTTTTTGSHGVSAQSTAWSHTDLPAPGYTGVMPRHLRQQRFQQLRIPDPQESMHNDSTDSPVNPLIRVPIQSSDHHTNSGITSQDPEPGSLGTTNTNPSTTNLMLHPDPGCQATSGNRTLDIAVDGNPPWDFTGAGPPSPELFRRGRGYVHGSPDQRRESVSPDVSPSRRQKRAVPGAAAAQSELLPRWGSVDNLSALYGSKPGMFGHSLHPGLSYTRSYTPTPMSVTASWDIDGTSSYRRLDTAPGIRFTGKGKGRYPELAHPDTTHVTGVMDTCAHWCNPDETWVRKNEKSFMSFQAEDKAGKQRKHAAVAARDAVNQARVHQRVEQDATIASAKEQAILTNKGMARARYLERCALYEKVRTDTSQQHANALYNRSLYFTDHIIMDPILARPC